MSHVGDHRKTAAHSVSLENPEGTREAIACDLERYGTVRYVDIKDSAFKPEQIKLEETT